MAFAIEARPSPHIETQTAAPVRINIISPYTGGRAVASPAFDVALHSLALS
jgi:hypothetical protein